MSLLWYPLEIERTLSQSMKRAQDMKRAQEARERHTSAHRIERVMLRWVEPVELAEVARWAKTLTPELAFYS